MSKKKFLFFVVMSFFFSLPHTLFAQVPLFQFGTRGSAEGQFYYPFAIEVTSDRVFVSDRINENVSVFSSAGVFISQFGSAGYHTGEFNSPVGLAVSQSGMLLYVVDLNNSRVQWFASPLFHFVGEFGSYGVSPGQFQNPYDVAVSKTGKIWVADSNNLRLQRFSIAGVLEFVLPIGAGPRGIAIDDDGNVFVTEVDLQRVQKFSPEGELLLTFGGPGSAPGQFLRPYGIDADWGVIVVADKDNNRIQMFSAQGVYLLQFGGYGTSPGKFDQPTQVKFHPSNGNLYVVDSGNTRVQVFAPASVGANPITWGALKSRWR